MSPAATAEQWLNTETIANLSGMTPRWIEKRIKEGFYKTIRSVEGLRGGDGGKIVQIALSCLPETLQAVYRAQQAIAAGCTETEQAAPESYHKVSETERKVAMERLRVVKAWELEQEQWPGVDKQDLLPAFCKRYGISRSTLYKWEADFRDNGLNGLLPAETRYGKRGSYKMDPEAYDYLLALYLNDRKRTVAYCYMLLKEAARDKGWRIPSLRSVQRIIKELPESVRMAAREHGKTVYDKCLPYTDRDTGKILSNQVWVGDHFRCDFFVKDHGKWIRPWITAWLDMRSRRFMGWTVCKTPSTGTIIDSFARIALDPAIGLPLEIYIDNGRDYCSKEFAGRGHRKKALLDEREVKTMLDSLDVKVHFAIPENGRAKVIEREFRTVAEEICKEFPTWCASKPGDRPEDLQQLLKKDLPCMNITLEEAADIIGDWFTHVKNETVSSGKGRKGETPNETFNKNRMPLRIAPADQMRVLLMRHSQPLKIRNAQVVFRGSAYYHQELVKRYGEKVYVRYNENDLSRVSIYDLDDRWICDAVKPEAIPGVGADKEALQAEQRRKAKARKILYSDPRLKTAKETKVYDIAEIIAKKKEAGTTLQPERPDVILPVAVGQVEMPLVPVRGKKKNKYDDVLKYLNKKEG